MSLELTSSYPYRESFSLPLRYWGTIFQRIFARIKANIANRGLNYNASISYARTL